MKSRRSWLIGLALGAALFFGAPSAKAQTVPRSITYQGVLEQGGIPVASAQVELDFYFTDSAGYSNGGLNNGGITNAFFHQTSTGVQVTDGVFNVLLGDPAVTPGGFPLSMKFDKQYVMTVVVNNTTLPVPVFLWSAPYALNAERVGGLDVSPQPVNGDLFPMPLDPSGKISTTMLPQIPNSLLQTQYVETINGVDPNATTGNIDLVGAGGIVVTPGPGASVTITGPSAGQITGVFGENGLTGGGVSGNLYLGIGTGAITHEMLGVGAITGQTITGIAGNGLSQDAAGLLDVNVDNVTIGITTQANGNYLEVLPLSIGTAQLANGAVTSAKIAPGAVGAAQVDPTQIQLRVTGTAPSGSFITGITQAGGVTTGTVLDPTNSLTITPSGSNLNAGFNLGHTNAWTVLQTFTGITDVGTITNTGAIANAGTLTNVGAITQTGGNVSLAGTSGNTVTIGISGGANATTINGALTQSGGNASIAGATGANSFGTGGNVTLVANTFGSTGLGSTNTFNGASTFTGTLASNGNSTIGNTSAATVNSFGTAGNGAAATNTIGSTVAGSSTTTNGNVNAGASSNSTTNTFGTSGNTAAVSNTIGSTVAGSFTTVNGNVNVGASSTSLTNSFGVGANALSVANIFGSQGAGSTNTFYGTTAFTTVPAGTNGTRVTITGAVTPVITSNNDYELIVNGDAQITGTMNVGNFTATTITATTVNATTVNATTVNATNGNFTTLNVTGASTQNTITTSGAITDNSNSFTLGAGVSNYQGTQVVSQGAIPGGTNPPASYVYTWPDKSGTVAMLSDIQVIGAGTVAGQTLWWTGNVGLPNNTWQATSLELNRPDLNTVTFASGTTINTTGGTNNFGSTNNLSGTTNLSGSIVNVNTAAVDFGPVGNTISSQDVFTEGISGGGALDKNWFFVTGVPTTWTNTPFTPVPGPFPNPPVLPATGPFPNTNFEFVVAGDEEITGTLFSAADYASLVAAPNLRFDIAEPFSQTGGNTMTLSGAATGSNVVGGTAGTPVVTINNIPAGSFGEQVTASGSAAGGIQVNGASAGTGIVIDPFPIGEDISATGTGLIVGGSGSIGVPPTAVSSPTTGINVTANTTGETLNMTAAASGTGTGLAIGANVPPATGGTVNATVTGLAVTAPTSTFTGTTAGTNVVVVSNTANGNNGTGLGLQVNGTASSTGNSTLGTGSTALANSFGTGNNQPNVINTIGSSGGGTSSSNVNGELTTTINNEVDLGGIYVAGVNTTSTSTSTGLVGSIGINATATTSGTGLGSLGQLDAGGVIGVAVWGGAAANTNEIIQGVTGQAVAGTGVTAIGVAGISTSNNTVGDVGVIGRSVNTTGASVGTMGTSGASAAQVQTLGLSEPSTFGAGVMGYNPNSTVNQYAGYFQGAITETTPTNTSTDGNQLTLINGVISGTPPPPAAPAIPTISNNQYELTDNGDARITGSIDAGQVVTALLQAPKIRFDNAQPYTLGGTMTFDGSAPQGAAAGTPVVTITNVPNTSYGLQITPANNSAAGSIQVTGSAGNGIGVNINTVATGLQVTSPTTAGVNLASMGSVTGVNYSGTTGTGLNYTGTSGTGVNAVLSGAGTGVSARVNGAGAYTGPAGSAAIVGLQNSNGSPAAGVMGLNGVTVPSIDGQGAGVDGETNLTNSPGVSGVNSTVGANGWGVIGWATNATTLRAGVVGQLTAGSTQSYGLVGETNGSFTTTISNAAVLGLSSSSASTYGVGADNTVNGGTALFAQANGGGNVTGVSVKTTGASGFTAGVPNSTGVLVDVTSGSTTGIYVKGAGGPSSYVPATGTGIYVDPVAEGIVAVATSIGAEFMPQTNATGTGLNLGTSTGPFEWATGENVFATGTGINVTANVTGINITSPASIAANGTIITTGQGSMFGSTGAISGAATAVTIQNNDNGSSALVVNGGIAQNAVAGGNQPGLTFNNGASSSLLDVNGTGSTWSISKAGVFTGTSFVGGAGSFTTLTSSGATTLSTNGGNVTNSFGNNPSGAGNTQNTIGDVTTLAGGTVTNSIGSTVAVTGTVNNTIGATVAGGTATTTIGSVAGSATNTLNGLTTANPPTAGGAGTNTVTISGSPDAAGTWGLNVSSALTDANPSQAVKASATSVAGNSATGGQFNATGAGASNVGVALNTSGLSTGGTVLGLAGVGNVGEAISSSGSAAASNIGALVKATGNGSIGVDVLSAANTGVAVDASNASTQTGVLVSGARNSGMDVTFTAGIGAGSVWGYNADMTNGSGGANYSGFHIQNLAVNNTNGINVENMSAGNGISISNMSGGVGINVGMASSSAIGISADASNGGGATALRVVGNGTGQPGTSVALQVDNGQVKATGANPFSGRFAYTGGAGTVTISNALVGIGSSIMVTFESSVANGNTYGVSVQGVATGSFQVNCTSPVSGFLDYIIINH